MPKRIQVTDYERSEEADHGDELSECVADAGKMHI